VQVGDALVGVDHGQRRALRVDGGDVGLDLGLLGFRQRLDLGVKIAEPLFGLTPSCLKVAACFSKTSAKKTDTACRT
jgi:hypothetical protein